MIERWLTQLVTCLVFTTMYGATRALISIKLGDKGGDAKTRLSLNPFVHIDTVGFIFMFFFSMGFIKPMRNQSINFKKRKQSIILIATLPLLILVVLSTILFLLFQSNLSVSEANNGEITFLIGFRIIPNFIVLFVSNFFKLSIGTFVYNFIPVYPLECEKVLTYYVRPNVQMVLSQYDKVFQMGLILLTITKIIPWIVTNIMLVYLGLLI